MSVPKHQPVFTSLHLTIHLTLHADTKPPAEVPCLSSFLRPWINHDQVTQPACHVKSYQSGCLTIGKP